MSPRQSKILIVEDDPDINDLLRRILQAAGHEVRQAFSGTEARLYLDQATPDLVLLDLMLPGMTGEELIRHIRQERASQVPVIVLSAKAALSDKVGLLKTGADDYITKPFEPEEVVARVEAALRRSPAFIGCPSAGVLGDAETAGGVGRISGANVPLPATHVLTCKSLALNPELRVVTVKGKELSLTVKEYEILLLLLQNPGKVFSRESLYELVWHDGYYGSDHTVNVHVSNLRKKIKEHDPQGEYIKSVYGIGFKLVTS